MMQESVDMEMTMANLINSLQYRMYNSFLED